MGNHIHKEHNVSYLIYHFVCPAKYRRIIFVDWADETLKQICKEIEERYEIIFLEVWADKDHVHFLLQSVPMYAPKRIIQIIKSITGRQLFRVHPEIKKQLRWWELWTRWYYVNTVGQYTNEEVIRAYVKNQGIEWYKKLYKWEWPKQQSLFST